MRKTVLLILLVSLMVALPSLSHANRGLTMGYAYEVIADQSNIWTYPSTLINYPNMMVGQISSEMGFYEGGAQFGIGNKVVAVFFNNLKYNYLYLPNETAIDQRIAFLVAGGDKDIAYGVKLNVNGSSSSAEAEDYNPEVAITEFGLRLGLTYNTNLDAYLKFEMISWTHNDTDGEEITAPDGYINFGFGGRYWLAMSDRYTIIPHFSFAMIGQGYERKFLDQNENLKGRRLSRTYIDLGVGNNIKVSEKVLIVSNVGISLNPFELESTYRAMTETNTGSMNEIPYITIGFESALYSWLDLRMGIAKTWDHDTYEPDEATPGNPKTYEGSTNEDFFLGLGFHFKNLDIDMQMNPDMLTNGPYILTGAETETMATSVKLTYTWE